MKKQKVEKQKVEKKENEKVDSRKEENEKLKKENKQLRKNSVDVKIKESIETPIEIKSLKKIKISLKKFQLLLTAINLITGIKQVNSSILTLETWLIMLEIMQLVKQMLKKI